MPIIVVGEEESPGVKIGGIVQLVRREIEVECRAGDIPDSITISVAGMDIGDSIHIEEVELPKGVEVQTEVNYTVAAIVGIKTEEQEQAEAEAAEAAAAEAAAEAEAGKKYPRPRHNLGRDLLERMVEDYRLSAGGSRFKGRFGDGRIGSDKVLWLMPDTYMNLSGESVGEAVRFYKLTPDQVVVLHDDLDLPLGRIKMKLGGGNAGHNGLKSIQKILGSPDFVRIRLGIGRPPPRMDPAAFVLARFREEESRLVAPVMDEVPRVLEWILADNLPRAMSELARLMPPPA